MAGGDVAGGDVVGGSVVDGDVSDVVVGAGTLVGGTEVRLTGGAFASNEVGVTGFAKIVSGPDNGGFASVPPVVSDSTIAAANPTAIMPNTRRPRRLSIQPWRTSTNSRGLRMFRLGRSISRFHHPGSTGRSRSYRASRTW